MVSSLSRVWQHVQLSDVSVGTRPRYSLVVDEDVKKPTNQTNKTFHIRGESLFLDLDIYHLSFHAPYVPIALSPFTRKVPVLNHLKRMEGLRYCSSPECSSFQPFIITGLFYINKIISYINQQLCHSIFKLITFKWPLQIWCLQLKDF